MEKLLLFLYVFALPSLIIGGEALYRDGWKWGRLVSVSALVASWVGVVVVMLLGI